MTSLLTCRGVFNIRSGISTVFSLHRTIFRLIPPSYQSVCRGRGLWLTPRRRHRVAYPLGKYKADTSGNIRPRWCQGERAETEPTGCLTSDLLPQSDTSVLYSSGFHKPLPSPPHLTAHHICSYSIMCTLLCVLLVSANTHMYVTFVHTQFTVCIWGRLRKGDFKPETWFNTHIVSFHPTRNSEWNSL